MTCRDDLLIITPYAAADSVSDAVPDRGIGNESSWGVFALASGHWGSRDAKDNIPCHYYNAWTSLADLTVEPRWNWALRSHLGSRLRQRLHYEKVKLDLKFAALWLHDFHEANDVTARLSSLGEGASVSGIAPDRDAVEVRARLSLHQAKSLSLLLEYALTLSPDGREHSVHFGFRWIF